MEGVTLPPGPMTPWGASDPGFLSSPKQFSSSQESALSARGSLWPGLPGVHLLTQHRAESQPGVKATAVAPRGSPPLLWVSPLPFSAPPSSTLPNANTPTWL